MAKGKKSLLQSTRMVIATTSPYEGALMFGLSLLLLGGVAGMVYLIYKLLQGDRTTTAAASEDTYTTEPECSGNKTCPAGETCVNGSCVTSSANNDDDGDCSKDKDCSEGQKCENNKCVTDDNNDGDNNDGDEGETTKSADDTWTIVGAVIGGVVLLIGIYVIWHYFMYRSLPRRPGSVNYEDPDFWIPKKYKKAMKGNYSVNDPVLGNLQTELTKIMNKDHGIKIEWNNLGSLKRNEKKLLRTEAEKAYVPSTAIL